MKYSIFNTITEYGDKYLLHNTLSGNMIKIYDKDYAKILKDFSYKELSVDKLNELDQDFIECLTNYGFIIEDNYNEYNLLNYKFYIHQRKLDTILRVLIIPTRECNFRCPYCYENHEIKNMSKRIFDKSFQFIEDMLDSNSNYRNLCVDWFGGEPTLKIKEICDFMKRLRNKFIGTNIFGSMTSNGYLLNINNCKC